MQQKVQFLNAIIHEPDLLILDEPFSGLDPVNVEVLKEIILELKAAGKTIIFSTHQMEVAEKICDDICLINRSRKVLEGSIREVKRGFSRNAVALRLGGRRSQFLQNDQLISNVQRHSDGIEVLLAEGASRTNAPEGIDRGRRDDREIRNDRAEPARHFHRKGHGERMNKLLAIIRREYLQRVRTKFFVIMTVLGPFMLVVFTIVPGVAFQY